MTVKIIHFFANTVANDFRDVNRLIADSGSLVRALILTTKFSMLMLDTSVWFLSNLFHDPCLLDNIQKVHLMRNVGLPALLKNSE
jgi:hypothetical protein